MDRNKEHTRFKPPGKELFIWLPEKPGRRRFFT
jgi:hypothetical protein